MQRQMAPSAGRRGGLSREQAEIADALPDLLSA